MRAHQLGAHLPGFGHTAQELWLVLRGVRRGYIFANGYSHLSCVNRHGYMERRSPERHLAGFRFRAVVSRLREA